MSRRRGLAGKSAPTFGQADSGRRPPGARDRSLPAHAAYAVKNLLKSQRVIPMHYGTFPPMKGTPAQFKQALGSSRTEVIAMEPGEKRTF